MTLFKMKKCPVFTRGRAQHAVFGVVATMLPGWLFHSTLAAGFGLLVTWIFAILWELLTARLAERFKWGHPFGDMIDLIAYVVGGTAGFIAISELLK